jgi:hypothetical protein
MVADALAPAAHPDAARGDAPRPRRPRHPGRYSSPNRAKVDAISAAQRSGAIPDRWNADDLLALVLTIVSMWTSMIPEYNALVSRHTRAHRRQVVIDAVQALLA